MKNITLILLFVIKSQAQPTVNEFSTACSAACNSGAMMFGDINNKKDNIVALKDDDRAYHLLESVGTKPNVVYQTIVRNTKEA